MNSKSFRILEHAKPFPSKTLSESRCCRFRCFHWKSAWLAAFPVQKSSVWWKRRGNYHKNYTFLIVSSSWSFSEITIPARCAFYEPSGETRLKMPACQPKNDTRRFSQLQLRNLLPACGLRWWINLSNNFITIKMQLMERRCVKLCWLQSWPVVAWVETKVYSGSN